MDRFVVGGAFKERCNGNIPYAEIISFVGSIEDIMEQFKICSVEQLADILAMDIKVQSDNQDLNRKVENLKKELSDKESKWAKWCEEKLKTQAKRICDEIKKYTIDTPLNELADEVGVDLGISKCKLEKVFDKVQAKYEREVGGDVKD